MDHNARIEAAIEDLESQDHPNITAAATKWKVARETLSKRFRGETTSRQEATSQTRKNLTDVQEETLITYINKLSDRGLPPTPQIVKNLAEEIVHKEVGPNWVSRFIRRHHDQLKSVYLRTIDHKRKIADNAHHFRHFYDTVRTCVACVAHDSRLECC
jgi:Tc5 transposase DNA-binding domain